MKNRITNEQSIVLMEKNIILELPGKQFWGDINLSIDEYEALRDRVKESINSFYIGIETFAKRYPVALTTLLVFFARYKYNTNYWGLLEEELSVPITGPIEAALGTIVRDTFDKYGFDFSDVKNERRINLEPIIYEAGLPPESSLDDLFYILNYDSHTVFDPQLIIEDLVEMRSYQIRKPMLKFLKRFKGDRAVEFILDVHEAMLCIDQSMTSDSQYIGIYSEWKSREKTKETIHSRKKQEFQTKPYLAFDNNKWGLCLVLPRVLLKDEWIEDVSWHITSDLGSIQRKLNVFGDEGKRFIDSIIVPVCPSSHYKISLIDEENLEDPNLTEWAIEGIQSDDFLVFNANGRLITPNYIPDPFGIVVLGNKVSVSNTRDVSLRRYDYPTSRPDYTIQSFESTSRNGTITFSNTEKTVILNTRPQVDMAFTGKTLFSIDSTDDYKLYTEIPSLVLSLYEDAIINGFTLRIGSDSYSIDHLFSSGHAKIDLQKLAGSIFDRYGTYSVRLYQFDHFIKMSEFTYVPIIETDYTPYISWASGTAKIQPPKFKFKRRSNIQMEFDNCRVSVDENEYVVDCPLGMGAIPVTLNYSLNNTIIFSTMFELPVRPFEAEITDSEGNVKESHTGKTVRLGLSELQEKNLWISLRFLGDYKQGNYKIKLRTVNGIEQEEHLSLTKSGCTNKDLTVFYDTLQSCPLPAQIELWHEGNDIDIAPLLIVSDTVQLSCRPKYNTKGYIVLNVEDDGRDLTITSFSKPEKIYLLPYEKSRLGKSGKTRGYKCPEALGDGFYVIETNMGANAFEFEDDSSAWLTNGNETFYISSREKNAPLESFSDWLDLLMKDILKAGILNDINNCSAYRLLNTLSKYKGAALTRLDCERLIALAFFINSKCSNAKRNSIEKCMSTISMTVLNPRSRLEIIRVLATLQCPSEIFELCLLHYHLFLFSIGSDDAVYLAEQIENYSIELSMLLRMGVDDNIRDTVMREKYRDLIGKEAIRSMLNVPDSAERKEIIEEQRKFLREQPSKVRIQLSPDISGDMDPILAKMMKITYNKIFFNKAAKPDIGVYFDRIRYVDQYVNWYFSHAEPSWEIKDGVRQDISSVVQKYCNDILRDIKDIKKIPELKRITEDYETALKARYKKDPRSNLAVPIPARFFYLQGLAAYLAVLPKEYQKFGWAVRTGEAFMIRAFNIAPRIARRDILMASTYCYLVRKEERLCQ